MTVFPSREWVELVLDSAKANQKLQVSAKHWESDFLCIGKGDEQFLQQLSKKEVMEGLASFIGMIPAERRVKYKGTPTGDLLEMIGILPAAPFDKLDIDMALQKVSGLSADDIRKLTLYIWADFHQGMLRNLAPIAPGEHQDAVFKLSADYSIWKQIASGRQELIPLILTNKLHVEGYMSHIPTEKRKLMMRNMKSSIALISELLASVPV